MPIKIALAGNPNSGKTTLFNTLTGSQQYVGNWPGVTVEKKEGYVKPVNGVENKEMLIADLPGIYSLSPYTLEEVVSRNYLLEEKPDAIINIVDATNIERNLYLTTQLMELGIPIVIALNMIDVVRKRGEVISLEALSQSLGCPVVEISAIKKIGIPEIVATAKKAAYSKEAFATKQTFSPVLTNALEEIAGIIAGDVPEERIRWYTVKFFEQDKQTLKDIKLPEDKLARIRKITEETETEYDDDCQAIVINDRYEFITKTVHSKITHKKAGEETTSDKIDKIVTHPIFALPIFAAVMFLVYYLAMSTLGTGLTDWVNDVLFGEIIHGGLSTLLESINANAVVSSLLLDGILAGVGAVLGFLPQMIVLFLLLAVLEDCGYMSRIAFIMDRLFRRFGLSGKSFIPMLVSTGCGVPGVMASRTIESEKDRRMTVMTTTFMPCSAKLPVIALIGGAFFGSAWWIAPLMYFMGIAIIIISGIILKKTKMFSGEPSPFVMELPQYRIPSIKGILLTVWDKSKAFVIRAGTVIFLSSCIIWFLSTFNWGMQMVGADESMLATIGNIAAPIFAPLGFGDWRSAVATVMGLVAKENVVGTMGILFAGLEEVAEDGVEIWGTLATSFTPLAGFSFLIFNMFSAPCFAAIGAIKKELGTKWMFISVGYMTLVAYLLSFVIYQLGTFFVTGSFGIFTALAFAVVAFVLFMLFRPDKNKAGHEAQKKKSTEKIKQH